MSVKLTLKHVLLTTVLTDVMAPIEYFKYEKAKNGRISQKLIS